MADPIRERAVAKRDAAQRIVDKWVTFLEAYGELTGTSAEVAIALPDVVSRGPIARRPRRDRARAVAYGSELAKTIAATAAVLNDRGRPVRFDDLFNEVTKRGLVITGARPKDNYGARLYNSGSFRSLGKKEGWWFKDRPPPSAETAPPLADTDSSSGSEPGAAPGGAMGGIFASADKLNGGVSPIALMSMEGAAMGH